MVLVNSIVLYNQVCLSTRLAHINGAHINNRQEGHLESRYLCQGYRPISSCQRK